MRALSNAFWSGRRVFLTGHTGFKGGWLAHWLLSLGATVRGFALAPETAGVPAGEISFFDEMELGDRLDNVIGDIRDETQLRSALRGFCPEIVFHLAAQPLVRASYDAPVSTYAANVMGTVHVLDACRDLPDLQSVVIVSSDKCYDNKEQVWGYRETDAMGGHDPYSSSKGCTELVTSAFRSSYFASQSSASIMSARAGNVIGGGDWSVDRLIPDAMRAMRARQPLLLRFPKATRPWQHVLEPLSGYLTLAQKGAEEREGLATGWNFGPGEEAIRDVSSVIQSFADLLGPQFQWRIMQDAEAPHEAGKLALDCSLARQRLNWQPTLDWTQTISMTAAWYGLQDRQERRTLIGRQIAQFTELCEQSTPNIRKHKTFAAC